MINPYSTHTSIRHKPLLAAVFIVAVQYTYLFITVDFANSGANSYGVISEHLFQSQIYSLDGEHPTFSRPPLYPFLLMLTRMVSAAEWSVLAISVQALLGLGSLVLVYATARRVFAEQSTSHIAVLLYALHLTLHKEQLIQRETALFEFLILAFVFLIVTTKVPLTRVITTAILAGLAFLTRPTGFWLFPILLAYITLYPEFHIKEKIKLGVLALIAFEAILLPWQIYHFRNFGEFSFATSSNAGVNIFKGNARILGDIYPAIDVDQADDFIDSLLAERELVGERERNRYLTEQGVADIVADPAGFLQRFVQKSIYFFSPIEIPFGRGGGGDGQRGALNGSELQGWFWYSQFHAFYCIADYRSARFHRFLSGNQIEGYAKDLGIDKPCDYLEHDVYLRHVFRVAQVPTSP